MSAQACCTNASTAADFPPFARLAGRVDKRLAHALRAGADWFRGWRARPAARPLLGLPPYLLDDVDASGELRHRSERAGLSRQLSDARLRRGWIDSPW